MSAATLSGPSLASVHQQFEAALPAMDRVLEHHAGAWPSRCREEMIADARAALWAAWHSLTRRGKDPLKVGVTGIAARCCRYVRSGRRVGNITRGRACLDVLDHRAQRRLGIEIVSLDQDHETVRDDSLETWREWLAEDRRTRPCDAAAFTIDFGRWLANLSERKRRMAELLVVGEETSTVARQIGVTPGAVIQTRSWLESSWRRYQGETGPVETARRHPPVGRPHGAYGRALRLRGKRTEVRVAAS
jgi:hypothetical protein